MGSRSFGFRGSGRARGRPARSATPSRMATARPPPWHRPLKHDAYGEINSSVIVFQNAISLHCKMVAGAVLLGDGTFLCRLLTRPRKVSKIFGVVFSITYHGSKSRVSFTCQMRRCRDSVDRLWNAPGMRWDQCLREAAFKHYLRRLEPHVLAMFNNKNEFNKQCRALGVPMPTPIDLLEGLPHGVDLFVKPNSGTFGRGVRAFSWRDGKLVNAVDHEEIIDEDVLVAELRGQDVVVEERLFNHQSIIELVGANANALCTFRVLTVADASMKAVHCVACLLRLSTRDDVAYDNSSGSNGIGEHKGYNVFVNCDWHGGRLTGDAYNRLGFKIAKHPITGATFDGHAIPKLPEVVQCACQWHIPVAKRVFVAPVRVVAWDVALTDSGEVRIIEVNEIGARFFQVATGGWLADAELADALKSTDSLACWIQRTI